MCVLVNEPWLVRHSLDERGVRRNRIVLSSAREHELCFEGEAPGIVGERCAQLLRGCRRTFQVLHLPLRFGEEIQQPGVRRGALRDRVLEQRLRFVLSAGVQQRRRMAAGQIGTRIGLLRVGVRSRRLLPPPLAFYSSINRT